MFKDTKLAVSLAGVFASPTKLALADSHGPAKTAFCRYRQGKLVYINNDRRLSQFPATQNQLYEKIYFRVEII